MKQEFFEELKEKIQPYFEDGGSHGFDHTQRVYNLAVKIGNVENADMDIVKASAFLHDISRLKEDNNEIECHAEDGSKIAEKILKEMRFPEEKIKKVSYAIRVHRHSKSIKAETKEAEILQDADRLDALGAITIARMFSTSGKIKRPLYNPDIPLDNLDGEYKINNKSTIHGFYAKILKIKPEKFNTDFARKLAKKRYEFVEEFVDRFLKEWNGEM